MACRIGRTSEWTTRILHELIGKSGCFITLTYNNDNLPVGETLVKEHLQLFLKRLRKYLEPTKIKYFACGEYGEKTNRPHYHLIIIGWLPELKGCYSPDKKRIASRHIESLWKFGNNTVGYPDREAIQYTVGYIRKKLFTRNDEPYEGRLAPFQLQSQGLGKDYALAHRTSILQNYEITRDGINVGVPRYYRKKLIDKDSVEEYEYHRMCEQKRNEEIQPYKDVDDRPTLDYYYDRASDRERRRKHLEASEKIYKKGSF